MRYSLCIFLVDISIHLTIVLLVWWTAHTFLVVLDCVLIWLSGMPLTTHTWSYIVCQYKGPIICSWLIIYNLKSMLCNFVFILNYCSIVDFCFCWNKSFLVHIFDLHLSAVNKVTCERTRSANSTQSTRSP